MNPVATAPAAIAAPPAASTDVAAAEAAPADLFAQLLAASAPAATQSPAPASGPMAPGGSGAARPATLDPALDRPLDPALLLGGSALAAMSAPASDDIGKDATVERRDDTPTPTGEAPTAMLPALLLLLGPLPQPPAAGEAAGAAAAPSSASAAAPVSAPGRNAATAPMQAPAAAPADAAPASVSATGSVVAPPLPDAAIVLEASGASAVARPPSAPAPASNAAAVAPAPPPGFDGTTSVQDLPAAAPAEPSAPGLQGDELADALATRLSWQAGNQVGRAEIRVSPPELGAIEIDLQLDGNRLRAEFTSANAEVRHAIESSLPRLRELLDGHGLQLVHAEVGGRGHSTPQPAPPPRALSAFGPERAEPERPASAPVARRIGLLDEYA